MRKTLLCLTLLACGDDDSSFDLDERRFTLQSGHEAVAGTTPRLTFDEGEVDYFGGCNAASGAFSIDGDTLVVKGVRSDAAAACDDARHAQDTFFMLLLIARPKITLAGDTLTLSADGTTLVFVEEP